MIIQGFQKLTLLDFPGVCACTVFTPSCNLRCPFCHNASLVLRPGENSEITEDYIFSSFLPKRKGIIEGVAITGGEPLLQPDIFDFVKKIKDMGFKVKLDTNGTMPSKVKEIVDNNLVDYIAMDVKASPEMYPKVVGIDGFDISVIEKSISLIMNGNVDYEFRTTVVNEFHDLSGIKRIGEMINGCKRHYIQAFKDSGDLIGSGLSAVSKENMIKMRDIMSGYASTAELRGI
ncbi:MAG: anaerobic ribonucleoside-triphosphate reductase activating protein [Clostridiales bacterium]|nr:anaerobic ribonucleoside-triphosphate reductase activating protein [Clostridiales bacterium]